MGEFLTFLADKRAGIWVLLVVLGAGCAVVQWVCWIFRVGRFRSGAAGRARQEDLRFVTAEFFVRLINDFRHLLALVVVFMFALVLFAAMLPGLRNGDIATIKEGLQAVAAALAGLIGSIIGYYFGESAAAKKEQGTRPVVESRQAPVQAAPGETPEIRPATRPPATMG
jgi:hypothetical protein